MGFTGTIGTDNLEAEGFGGGVVVQIAADGRDDGAFISVGENKVANQGFPVLGVGQAVEFDDFVDGFELDKVGVFHH